MVGERDIVEIMIGVVGVERRPGAVRALQPDDPFARAGDRFRVALLIRPGDLAVGAVHRHRHDRRVVEIGIMRIGVLERPASRPGVRPLRRPVADDVEDLQGLQPLESSARPTPALVVAGFEQRMHGERRVPHRRQARLAIGLVVPDDEQLVERPPRLDAGADRLSDSRGRRT